MKKIILALAIVVIVLTLVTTLSAVEIISQKSQSLIDKQILKNNKALAGFKSRYYSARPSKSFLEIWLKKIETSGYCAEFIDFPQGKILINSGYYKFETAKLYEKDAPPPKIISGDVFNFELKIIFFTGNEPILINAASDAAFGAAKIKLSEIKFLLTNNEFGSSFEMSIFLDHYDSRGKYLGGSEPGISNFTALNLKQGVFSIEWAGGKMEFSANNNLCRYLTEVPILSRPEVLAHLNR